MSFRDKLARFFYGRNGADQLCRFLIIFYAALALLNFFFRSIILSAFITVIAVWCFFRMLSKNIYARQKENKVYLDLKTRFTSFFKLIRNRFRDRKTHVYRHCPHCRATLRMPKRKGQHSVRCPRCGKTFDIRI